jgi:murein DD-endopeptidase MepM/ murein hydrolase activator NlpD
MQLFWQPKGFFLSWTSKLGKGKSKVMNKFFTGALGCLGAIALIYVLQSGSLTGNQADDNGLFIGYEEASIVEPTFIYGFADDAFEFIEGKIKRNQNLSQILSEYNVSYSVIDQLARKSKDIFDVRKLAVDKPYLVLLDKDSLQAKYFIYTPNPVEYVVYELDGDLNIQHETKEIEIVERSISGVVTSSVYKAMLENGGNDKLVDDFADIFGWKIDFTSIQKGDFFRVVYEEKQVEGEAIGIGRIIAAEMNHWGKPLHAFQFDQGEGFDYFDVEGNSLKRAFLRYPVNFSRISSYYSPNRLHPVTKVNKPHLGTDFAAPTGTPIKAAADGVVEVAGFTSANGNWVKIKHNGTYTTGYLHMSRIEKGVKAGTRVKQGQVIGYVGSTGLATGPHLCYRFWKNGVQVDALKVDLPPETPIKPENKMAYEQSIRPLKQKLDAIPVLERQERIVAAN